MAWTERYITDSGSALNGGTNDTSDAWDFATGWASLAASISLNIKQGTYSSITNPGTAATATSTTPCRVRGYITTAGDYAPIRKGDGTLDTSNMVTISMTAGETLAMEPYCQMEGLNFSFNYNGTAMSNSNASALTNVIIDNASTGASASCFAFTAGTSAVGCEFRLSGGSGGARGVNMTNGRLYGCFLTGGAVAAIRFSGSNTSANVVVGCTVYNSAQGIDNNATGANCFVADSTFYNCSSDCIRGQSSATGATTNNLCMVNCHATDSLRFYNNQNASIVPHVKVGNRTRDNSNADATVGDYPNWQFVTTDNGDARSDYQDYAAKNFTLRRGAVGRVRGIIKGRDIGSRDGGVYRNISGKQAARDYGFRFGERVGD